MRQLLVVLLLALCAACTGNNTGGTPEAALSQLLGSGADPAFPRATAPRTFRFPEDHGAHPEYRNEWWYVTGNLRAADGRRFGYELTLFRFALTPQPPAEPHPAWLTNQVFIGHFALTDAAAQRFHAGERFSRGAAGLAGAENEPLRVWLYDWSLRQQQDSNFHLAAADAGIALDVALEPLKPPVLQGDAGLSRKSSEPGNASYYYSLPRLATSGTLLLDGESIDVSGLSWMDREWSTSALGDDQQGWDWFALQFDDGSDLMYYSLRRQDGSEDNYSAGTFVAADGTSTPLGRDDVRVTALGTWDSPAGGTYPSGWRLEVPAQGIDVRVEPVMDAQEMTTWIRYWEGAVDVSGMRGGEPLGGHGYVELTGYAIRRAAAD